MHQNKEDLKTLAVCLVIMVGVIALGMINALYSWPF